MEYFNIVGFILMNPKWLIMVITFIAIVEVVSVWNDRRLSEKYNKVMGYA